MNNPEYDLDYLPLFYSDFAQTIDYITTYSKTSLQLVN